MRQETNSFLAAKTLGGLLPRSWFMRSRIPGIVSCVARTTALKAGRRVSHHHLRLGPRRGRSRIENPQHMVLTRGETGAQSGGAPSVCVYMLCATDQVNMYSALRCFLTVKHIPRTTRRVMRAPAGIPVLTHVSHPTSTKPSPTMATYYSLYSLSCKKICVLQASPHSPYPLSLSPLPSTLFRSL
jgi:hypothetical protein